MCHLGRAVAHALSAALAHCVDPSNDEEKGRDKHGREGPFVIEVVIDDAAEVEEGQQVEGEELEQVDEPAEDPGPLDVQGEVELPQHL